MNPPWGARSTELDDETGHNCKMPQDQYRTFSWLVLGLDDETWANHRTESALCNLILQDLDALLYYFDTDWRVLDKPMSLPREITDMAIILAWITLLLIGADTCTPRIIKKIGAKTKLPGLTSEGPEVISHPSYGEY